MPTQSEEGINIIGAPKIVVEKKYMSTYCVDVCSGVCHATATHMRVYAWVRVTDGGLDRKACRHTARKDGRINDTTGERELTYVTSD